MINSTFRDTLMLDNRDKFLSLIADVDDLKKQLQKEYRRVNKSPASLAGYRLVQTINKSLSLLLRTRRLQQDKAIALVKSVILKLRQLSQRFAEYSLDRLVAQVQRFIEIAFNLLPSGETLQLELFDSEYYHQDNPKPLVTHGLRKWLKYLFATPRLGLNYQAVGNLEPIYVVQLPLNLKLH